MGLCCWQQLCYLRTAVARIGHKLWVSVPTERRAEASCCCESTGLHQLTHKPTVCVQLTQLGQLTGAACIRLVISAPARPASRHVACSNYLCNVVRRHHFPSL